MSNFGIETLGNIIMPSILGTIMGIQLAILIIMKFGDDRVGGY